MSEKYGNRAFDDHEDAIFGSIQGLA